MYTLVCHAGFPMPLKAGKYDVCQIEATVSDPTADSRLTLIDDTGLAENAKFGRILDSSSQQTTKLCDIKGLANIDARLSIEFKEPIKIRKGLSAINTSNLVPGSIFVFIR